MIHFTMFTEKPTDPFLKAIETAGITVRGWEIPAYRFRARKTSRNTLKVEGRGWIDPNCHRACNSPRKWALKIP